MLFFQILLMVQGWLADIDGYHFCQGLVKAKIAAWLVPQPAMRISRSGLYSRSGHNIRCACAGSNHSQWSAVQASRSATGRGYLHRSYWRRTASAPGSSFTSPVTSLRVDADPGSASA
ncbi:hypothetical protein I553_7282 [Mycobacterium xenopi 4042]|uniref:Uncharacterized protein n=1 Tax=Mycobacterium xenopi 4042 TaxID=1299334 RepID=X8E715_MYCXE|nr:hypothetical protein I553_7282 [Mycobacterium xenopi 4042]